MKKSILNHCFLIAALALCACDNLDNIDVPVSGQATVPAATPIETLLGGFPQTDGLTRFDVSESSEFTNGQYSVEDVDRVILKSMSMRVVGPSGQDLSFFGTVRFVLETEGLPSKVVAERTGFDGLTQAEFMPVPDDIKEYVLAKKGTLTTQVEDSRRPEQENRNRAQRRLRRRYQRLEFTLGDLNLPSMGGFEFLDEVRADDTLRQAVVFVLTTSSAPDDVRAAYKRNVAGLS